MNIHRIMITSLLFSLVTVSANAGTYKWLDDNGNVVYSQQPPEGRPYESVKTTKPNSVSLQPSPTEKSFISGKQEEDKESELDRKVEQVAAKDQQMRADNCKAAKNNLQTYTVYRRIQNEDGEIIRLDDNERARLIEESKEAIKEFCD